MSKRYVPIISDAWEYCPGEIIGPAFKRRREAKDWIAAELDAASALFEDGRAQLIARVEVRS